MLHELTAIVRRKKRLGRGIAGRGAKSGRGQKGQRSRAGSRHKAGFEGGQTPIYMRLPKGRGTKQRFPTQLERHATVRIGQLESFKAGMIVGLGQLRKAGLLSRHDRLVKLVGGGKLSVPLTVRVHRVSAGAKEIVEQAGGKVEIIQQDQ